MEYHGIDKTTKIGEEIFTAFFPLEHSRLVGIIVNAEPIAQYHGRGVVPDAHLRIFAFYRGSDSWKLELDEIVEPTEVPTVGDVLFSKEVLSPEVIEAKEAHDYQSGIPFN